MYSSVRTLKEVVIKTEICVKRLKDKLEWKKNSFIKNKKEEERILGTEG